jgi:hypothetical protein
MSGRLPSLHINAGFVYLNAVALLASAKEPFLETNTLASTIFAALSLETFINEMAHLAHGTIFRGTEGEWLQTFGDIEDELEVSHAPINAKYMMGKFILSGVPFDKSRTPYQEFALLIKLRNEIAHQKPYPPKATQRLTTGAMPQRPVLQQLRSLGVLREPSSPSVSDVIGTNWLQEIATRKMAAWACNVAVSMVHTMLEAVPNGEFRNALETFCRAAFKRVRPSGLVKET